MESRPPSLLGRVKLRHVRCFVAVARAGSLARAAETLALGQPAVSKTLAELEAVLGARLVQRSRRGARLTAAGRALLPRAAASLVELERGLDALAGGAAPLRLRVGALPTVAAHVAPRAVERFLAEAPEVVVMLATGPNLHLLDLLRADRLDLVVGRLAAPEAMRGFAFAHLYSEPVRFVVRPGHPLVARPDPRRLGEHVLLLPDRDAVIRPAVDRLLITLGLGEPARRVETVSNAFGRNFVRDTDAVWLISEGVVARDLADGTLAIVPIDTKETLGPVGLTTRDAIPAEATAPYLRRFGAIVREVADGQADASREAEDPDRDALGHSECS